MPHHMKDVAEEIVLRGALGGIKKEILKLKKEKVFIEKKFSATEGRLKLTRQEEIKLRKRLTEMANLETILLEEREEMERKFRKVSEKVEKIRRIEEDLEEI